MLSNFLRVRFLILTAILSICGNTVFSQTQQRVMQWNFQTNKAILEKAPLDSRQAKGVDFNIPMPDGSFYFTKMVESPILSKEASAKNPGIRSYLIKDENREGISGRVNVTPSGLYGFVLTLNGFVLIQPETGLNQYKVFYAKRSEQDKFECFANELVTEEEEETGNRFGNQSNGATTKTYQIAIVVTDEFETANAAAGPVVVATNTMTAITAIYEREIAVKFTIVNVALEDPGTYNINAGGGANANEALCAVRAYFPNQNDYDLGHVFHTPANGGGGVAYLGVVCSNNTVNTGICGNVGPIKAGGWSGNSNNTTVGWYSLLAHEIGHMFNATHTFNGNSGSCNGNITAATSFEPGSGTTIMSYSQTCNGDNILLPGGTATASHGDGDDYHFHSNSLDRMITYINGGGSGCSANASSGNTPPVATANPGGQSNITIPKQTPFKLTGSATDANGDLLCHSWEQMNAGPPHGGPGVAASSTTGPIFRVWPPENSPSRTFPALPYILSNDNVPPQVNYGERLPGVARTLNFNYQVRDNRSGGGGVDCDPLTITVSDSGPLRVTAPDAAGISWAAGSSNFIGWNVNGTNGISTCANVNILLSVDGGVSFPYVLAANTPNDGDQTVTIPASCPGTTRARIMVECNTGNQFIKVFDICGFDFTITNANCAAAPSRICPDNAMSVNAGAGALNMSLSQTYGGIPTLTTSLSVTMNGNPSMQFVYFNTTTNMCATWAGNFNYSTFRFSVDKTGVYNFQISATNPGFAGLSLFSSGFNPATPCATYLGSTVTGDGSGSFGSSGAFSVNLTACSTYVLVLQSLNNATLTREALISSDGGRLYSVIAAPNSDYSYTYIAVNTTNNQVALVSATSNFTALAGGTYCIYGVSYRSAGTGSVDPNTFVGMTLDAILNNCIILSNNCRMVTVTGGCTPPTITTQPMSQTVCVGANVTFSVTATGGSLTYQWRKNAVDIGGATNSTYTINNVQASDAATYTVVVSNGTNCSTTSNGAVLTVNPLPTAFNVTGGGSFCAGGAGVAVGLSGSQAGVNYQLLLNGSNSGAPVAGTGAAISFGNQTAAGTYTVVATNTTTSCTATMTGSATVTVNPLPTAFNVTGGGSFCAGGAGVAVGLSSSQTGVNYQLLLNGSNSGAPVAGTGAAISFGNQTAAGTYTVVATNTTTNCTATMTGNATVTVNPLPTAFNVTGGGSFCAGGAGVAVGLSGSQTGVNYQLLLNGSNSGAPVAGTGAAISFGNQTAAGTYTVVATNTTTNCTATMTGSATVIVNPLPTAFNVTGGGSFCAGGAGVVVGLSGSQTGVNYQLLLNGSNSGAPVAGTGAAISFGNQTAAGTYTVVATNTTTSCTATMTGSATVTVNPLPTAFNVTGGGSFCAGGAGVAVGLSSSQTGVNYQLLLNGSNSGAPVAGTGAAISFGNQTVAGTYTVVATNATTSCTVSMTGNATVTVNPLPTAFNVTGGGSFCAGGAGVAVGLSGSQTGVNYQLLLNGSNTGSPLAGTGAALSFGNQTVAGTYTVVATNATTSCTATMTGSATVTVNPLPTAFNVTGGGSFCAGGAGVAVGLSGSQTGVNYQLLLNGSNSGAPVAGTGAALSFGNQTVAGTYTVVATNTTTSCTATMTGSVTVTVNPLPTVFNVTGGGQLDCAGTGVPVGLSGSEVGVNYQLRLNGTNTGNPVAGTGAALSFGNQTVAGTYTVVATNATTSCTANMNGSAIVTNGPQPMPFNVTGGGSFCAGGAGVVVGLSGSETGVNYQLLLNGTNTGAPVGGTGAAISFGNQTTAGTYTVVATNTSNNCTATMVGSATVTVNPLPTVFNVTGGGSYCAGGAGLPVGLSGSQAGVNYQLLLNGSNSGAPVAGTGAAISFGNQTSAGTYTVVATNATTSCTANMTGSASISINPAPSAFNVTGGGSFCAGGAGVVVGLSGSQTGVNYQLQVNSSNTGSPLAGTGAALSFGNQTVAGTYTVVATNTTTSCTATMTGSATVTVNPLPTAFNVTGGGSFCAGGAGVAVGLSSSQTGVNYQLLLNGSNSGAPVGGTGAAISFGNQTAAGTYTVVATNTTTSCSATMTGSATVTVNPLPTVFNVTGGGSYCAGGAGVAVGLSGSETGVNYQLKLNGTNSGAPVAGTGAAISFGNQTSAGTYTVVATNATTSCTATMTGSATVTINPAPTAFNVTGGGSFCAGGAGVAVGLSGSQTGVNYQLLLNGSNTGSPLAGTGAALSFGNQTVAGTYTVVATNATTSCTASMTGNATVTVNPLPTVFNVTGGGSYCAGGAGLPVGLSGSQAGVNYQLLLNGSNSGAPVAGTGAAISFGNQTSAGTYTVVATNATTSCTANMTGSASISINPAPSAFNVTGGGSFCAGGAGVVVGLSGSQTGVNYQLQVNSSNTGSPLAGTGAALSFGNQTVAGTYTVVATNATTSCTATMTGSATVTVNPLPTAFNVTGGGSFCAGGAGVAVGLNGSQTGVNYQLLLNGSNSGAPVAGTGAALSFGNQTVAGTYTVVATNATTSCTATMTGSVSISINPLPTVFNVTGGGSFCAGGAGVAVGLSGSQTGVNYQLLLNGSNSGAPVAGTGAAISFGNQTSAGTYTVVATNATTSCTATMTGSATVTVNPAPTAFNVTGGGSFCAGGAGVVVGLSGSQTGVNYQLLLNGSNTGSPLAGTGAALSFGNQTVAGTYTVVATNATTSCTATMTGSATVTVNPLPTVFNVTGGGQLDCAGTGVPVGLSGSQVGVNYQLLLNGSNSGAPVAGTGAALSFGNQQVAGTYTVIATNATTSCTANMSGSAIVTNGPQPMPFNVTGGGTICAGSAGVPVGLSGSETGVNYQLKLNGTNSGAPVGGTGAAISFGNQTAAGTYTVVATNATTSCTATMIGSATITVNPLPTAFNVTGGGAYCAGGAGVAVGLSGSQTGVNYQLLLNGNNSGAPVAGTGAAISFGNQTAAGTYTVVATNTTTSCTATMTGSATVTVNPLPTAFNVTGGGSYCAGGVGLPVGLSGSQTGVNYQLLLNGSNTGSPLAGTGAALSFGNQTSAGTYTVVATNATTSCTATMTGSATVTVNPAPTAFNVTGGGSFCAGGAGVAVGLSGSQTGVNYQLQVNSSNTGSPLAGTGAALSFGNQTVAGTYTVVATNATTSCTVTMTGSATVTVNPLPTAFNVTGGGSYCAGGAGLPVGLSGSQTGVNYQLLLNGSNSGAPVAGTGAAISFGNQTVAGTYTVVATNATTSCTSTMTGSATVTVNPLPTAFNVTGGGSYCAGGVGLPVGLSGSQTGVNYQLLLNGSNSGAPVAGTGTAISFGNQTAAGTYTVVATNATTSCTATMTGSVSISINPAPTAFNVTGGGAYCAGGAGVAVGLSGSQTGVNYQLLLNGSNSGAPVAGTGAAISFGNQTAAGTYTVVATNTTTSCTATMTGSATVTVNPLPTVFNVTGGGQLDCAGTGVPVGLSGSQVGVNYQLRLNGSNTGAPVAGTGAALSFGNQTVAGTYTVIATNATTSCTANMSGSAIVTNGPQPMPFNVTGGGTICAGSTGVPVGLSGSETGVNYQLKLNGTNSGAPVGGTGAAISFGNQTAAGTYTVVATNATTNCTANMTGSASISINPAPTAFNVTGGGSYCAGGAGLPVGLSGSQTGVNYQLLLNGSNTGSPLAGTGAALSFGNQTVAGTYTVVATNATTSCTATMTGSVSISINPLPTVFNVTGGGSFCAGGAGVAVGLSGSQTGVNYQLLLNGTNSGTPVAGTGAAISFGNQTAAGTYTVVATNATTSCTATMTGSATVTVNPAPTAFNVTGGGSFCAGGAGVAVGLSGSQTGVNYQLLLNGSNSGSPLAGTGAALSFGNQTVAGTYTVVATNATTSCTATMSGSVSISINPLPTAFNVTGGGSYCAGGAGLAVGLSGSQAGVNYQLRLNGNNIGAPVAGTGAAISFGNQTAAGTYTVVATNATTSCTATMTGSVSISINPLPTAFNVTGGGSYCAGGVGLPVGLSGSQTGVNYQLLLNGSNTGSPLAGTGAALSFGNQTVAGTYTVVATNATTSCTATMTGNATVTVNPLPTAFNVTGGGSFCAGGAGVAVGLSSSQTGVNYQLLLNGSNSGAPVAGTGAAISFGNQTAAGTYTVVATNATTSCTATMSGSVSIFINPLPTVFNMTGGGSYCAGGAGLPVGLSGSQAGVNYQLLLNGSNTGSPLAGTGAALSFGNQTVAGTYTVVATNATTSCTATMSGSATVTVNPLPTVFNTTGGGAYCSGGAGLPVGLSGSQTGVNYQLRLNGNNTGAPVAGTGAAISFGNQTAVGTYTVVATNATTSCTAAMSGSVSISINPLPVIAQVVMNPCIGGNTGEINLTVTGGSGTYTYNWTASGGGSGIVNGQQDQFNLTAGTYNVTVTDAITNCSATASYTLVGVGSCFTCPTMTAMTISGGTNLCASSTVNFSATGLANMSTSGAFGISFVQFGAPTTNPYSGGIVLATVTNAQLSGGGTTATSGNYTFPATTGTFYIYAIISPTPSEPTCRPFLTQTVVVTTCSVSIADPCVCKNNATTLTDGQFDETIAVTAPAGQTWTVTAVQGLYETSSPAPPAPPTPILIGKTLTPTATGYELRGVHIDALGYSLSVRNNAGLTLSVPLTRCYYPEPAFGQMAAAYCLGTGDLLLTATVENNPTAVSAKFVVNGTDYPATFNATTGQWEATYPITALGTYTLDFVFDAGTAAANSQTDPGCVQKISKFFNVVATPNVLTCNDLVHVSLEPDCSTEVTPDMILEGTYGCYDDYEVILSPLPFGAPIGNTVTAAHVGKKLKATVKHFVSNNTCWGEILVEDKAAPELVCENITIPCAVVDYTPQALAGLGLTKAFPNQLAWPNPNVQFLGNNQFRVNPPASDLFDCQWVTLSYDDTWFDLGCGAGLPGNPDLSGYVERVWTAIDASGNIGSCQQRIYLKRQHIPDVRFPVDITVSCENSNDTTVATTGAPYIRFNNVNFNIYPGAGACELNSAYSDQILPICDGSFKILRRWVVYDWCLPTNPGPTNPNPFYYIQVIKVLDDSGPTVLTADVCGKTIKAGLNALDCESDFDLPDLVVTDDCSRLSSVRAEWKIADVPYFENGYFADFQGNNHWDRDTLAVVGVAENLPLGTTTITYTLTDNCGNSSVCSFIVSVEDNVQPEVVCDEFTQVTLGVDGKNFVEANVFDDGSNDACSPVYFKARRMLPNECLNDNNLFHDQVLFCCADLGDTITVVLRVYDTEPDPDSVALTHLENRAADCMVQVFVEDKIKPTCIPPAHVTVSCEAFDPSLWAYGAAVSTDNCCLDSLTEIRNLAQFDTLCNRGTIVRRWTAKDCYGNTNACTQRIVINYNQDYHIRFPNDRVVFECDGTTAFGEPVINKKDCELMAISYEDQVFTVVPDACYKIERLWTIINWCTYDPNTDCIYVPNPSPNPLPNASANLQGPTVSPLGTPNPWAPTQTALEPGGPQVNFSQYWQKEANCYQYRQIIKIIDNEDPIITAHELDECDLTANDPLFWNNMDFWDPIHGSHDLCEAPVKLSITAIDSCSQANLDIRALVFLDLNGDGVMETVLNTNTFPTLPPGFMNINNAANPNYAGGQSIQFDYRPVPPNLRYRWALREQVINGQRKVTIAWTDQANPNNANNAHWVQPQVPLGKHKIKWFVEDNCGNETIWESPWNVRDCKAPTVVCLNGLSVNIMPTKMIVLWTSDFLHYGEDNCTPANQLVYSIRKSGTGSGFPVDQNGNPIPGLTWTCNELGTQYVELWAKDAAGNAAFCETYVIIQDPNGLNCTNIAKATVAGDLKTEKTDGLEDASVELSGTHPALPQSLSNLDLTDEKGHYEFTDAVPIAGNYTVTPVKDDNPLNGVTTFDLLLISKHILGVEPLTSPYKMIAADANRSGSITTFDIVEIRKLILGIYNELPSNTSWRFVDKYHNFADPNNPFTAPIPETISIADLQSNTVDEHFVAVKIGDVNQNAVANNLQSADDRTAGTLLFDVADREVKSGETVEVKFTAAEKSLGYQFTLTFNNLELLDILPASGTSAENFAVFAKEKALTTSVFSDEKTEFSIKFRATAAGKLSKMLGVSSRITKAEAYSLAAERQEVALRFNQNGTATVAGVGFELYQNQPNPFVNTTSIGFHLPEATEATLTVYDETGRALLTKTGSFAKGLNAITLERKALNYSGLLFYKLETATDAATRTMIQSK